MKRTYLPILICIFLGLILSACKSGPAVPSATPTPELPTATPLPPTPTPEPLAARVNDGGVTLAEFQAELTRLQAAMARLSKTATPAEQTAMVLDNLIAETLLAQAAYAEGYVLDEADLNARIQSAVAQSGGDAAFNEWLASNAYTAETFRMAMTRAMAADWQRSKVISVVPHQAEQVRARQILVLDAVLAEEIHQQLTAGADFETQSLAYDPVTGGMLGWFPRGYLTQKVVEDAAFNLQPGEFSGVVKSDLGYHIIQVLERDPEHEMADDALRMLQQQALHDWMAKTRQSAQIEILVK